MKTLRSGIMMAIILSLGAGTAFAIPSLQLNIAGGHYVGGTDETIYAPAGNTFDLYAYLIPSSGNTIGDTYFISAAVVPMISTSASIGSFTFGGGTPINVTGDMVYGTPPLETIMSQQGHDANDLATHGIFDTYYKEFEFSFSRAGQVVPFNTQDEAGSLGTAGAGMYYRMFTVDMTGLDPGYGLHFDLYNKTLTDKNFAGDLDVKNLFAPYSHDAQSSPPVPEPSTMLLLGSGLVGLAGWGRKKFRK